MNLFCVSDPEDPQILKEAMESENFNEWKTAMTQELKTLVKNNTWTEVKGQKMSILLTQSGYLRERKIKRVNQVYSKQDQLLEDFNKKIILIFLRFVLHMPDYPLRGF